MPFAQYFRDALNGLVGTVGASRHNDITEVQNADLDPTAMLSSAHLPTTDLPIKECSKGTARVKPQHPDTQPYLESLDNNAGELATSEISNLDSNNTDLEARNDESQQQKSYVLAERNYPKLNAEVLSAKDLEIAALRTSLEERDLKIRRLAENEGEVKRVLIREKNDIAHAMAGIERRAGRIEAENGRFLSEREKIEARAVRAEGCAKGLRDQLKATTTRAEHWEKLYKKTAEDARDKVLSAYAIPTGQVPTEDQYTTTTTTAEEQRLSVIVENLRKENSELLEKVRHQKAELETREQDWEDHIKELKEWEQGLPAMVEQDKQIAIETDRANGRATGWNDAREQDIRRECEEEKQQALAAEREKCQVQRETEETLLRAQYAKKVKAQTNRELERFRHRGATAHKKRMKVKKGGIKQVVNKAVSQAVMTEHSLLHGQFQAQFQIEISDYKVQLESEHAAAQTLAGAQSNTNQVDQALFNHEIGKRDDQINSHKNDLTDAFEANRKLEASLKLKKADIERLSRAVTTYESQSSLANKTQTEAQISLMARDLSRALKLLAEVSVLGLDEKHRYLLSELVLANKVVTNIRTTIEDESAVVDYDGFQGRLDRIMDSSDPFDALDSRERPALHAQLSETYTIVGRLSNILSGERGDGTRQDILKRIYRDNVKGKGKEGAAVGSAAASGSSSGRIGEAAPKNNTRNGLNDTSTPNSIPNPTATPSSATPNTTAGESQGEPEFIDSATAIANLDTSDAFDLDTFNLEDIDWSDPCWQNLQFPD